MRNLSVLIFCAGLIGAPALAQDDDRGRLIQFLETQLSAGDNRQVRIDGFRGALSSEAELDRLSVSDADGEWLVLENARLNWRRAALLSGALEVDALTAERLTILRPPLPPEGPDLPAPEATPFSLPDLPVSITIGELAIGEVALGAPIIGRPASLSVTGRAELANGSGNANLELNRLDGPSGNFTLDAAFANETRVLGIDLLLDEATGGLAAEILNLPGAPALRLEVAGEGPLNDIEVALSLATDNVERVGGTVQSAMMDDAEGQRITLDIAGDLRRLMDAQYRPFFGEESALSAMVERDDQGATELRDLRLSTASILLEGDVNLDAQSRLVFVDVDGRISTPDGGSQIQLPVSGDVTLRSADLSAAFDAEMGEAFSLTAEIDTLNVADFAMGAARLEATGQITPSATGIGSVAAELDVALTQLAHTDPALNTALGSSLSFNGDAAWSEGAPFTLQDMNVTAGNLSAEGEVSVGLEDSTLPVTFDLTAQIADLSRFSALSGQTLSGALNADLNGRAEALSGAFDISLTGSAQDLRADPVLPPELLVGETRLDLEASRDGTGTRIENLTLVGTQIAVQVAGDVSSDGGALAATGRLEDVGLFTEALSGPAAITAEVTSAAQGWDIDATLDGPQGIDAEVTGLVGLPDGGIDVNATARLTDLGVFTTALRGPASVTADIVSAAQGFDVDADLRGPGGIAAGANGLVGLPDGRVDLSTSGTAPLQLVNRFIAPRSVRGQLGFDLAMRGAPGLNTLSGQLTTTGARVVSPAEQFVLENVSLNANLSGGRISLGGNGTVSTGGQVGLTGTVDVGGPGIPGGLDITLDGVRLSDPTLYDIVIGRGAISVTGPLASFPRVAGQIDLGPSEIRVPETGLGSAPPIPDIQHVGETADERRTRAAAGLLARQSGSGGGGAVGLDMTINAPGRIFLRGRGIDAEFGGAIRVGGTSAALIPSGQFELIRGRIAILGTRLDLTEGTATLQGDFDPFLRLSAESRTEGYLVTITVEGPASAPEILLSSDPFLPEDEILAQLLFGRSVSALFPVQLLQLADAASSLAGGSSDGGVLSNLRDGLGLDDLDLQTDEEGNAAVRAGRYLSDNVYTDVTVGAEGESELSLNIDLTPDITARGSFSSDGSSGVGVFFERDY